LVSGATFCEAVLAAPVADASSADVLSGAVSSLAVLSVFVLPADLPPLVALPSLLSGAAVSASAPPDCLTDESSERLGGVWSVGVLSRDDLSDAEFRAGGAGGGDGSGACADALEGSVWKLPSSREAKPPSGGGDGSRTEDFGGALEWDALAVTSGVTPYTATSHDEPRTRGEQGPGHSGP
jgi:hypothetical protein